jgi:hypothetical protein
MGTAIGYLDIGGCKLRYIKAGRGPNLVLFHTLRTQLDLFEILVPELARRFTIYALDYPGHGYSDIPEAQYDAEFFAESVAMFLDVLDPAGTWPKAPQRRVTPRKAGQTNQTNRIPQNCEPHYLSGEFCTT